MTTKLLDGALLVVQTTSQAVNYSLRSWMATGSCSNGALRRPKKKIFGRHWEPSRPMENTDGSES